MENHEFLPNLERIFITLLTMPQIKISGIQHISLYLFGLQDYYNWTEPDIICKYLARQE